MNEKKQLEQLHRERQRLNEVSPSFCLAKWLQHTVYLQNGHNHSCHHPPTHKIPVEEVLSNHKALHNTSHKKQQMQMMLDGERPQECDYCWRVEDMGEGYFSDRVYKSAVSWSKPHVYDVLETGTDDIVPTYLEVSFSNVCNFKCAYCGPELSSRWVEEIQQHGPYPTTNLFNNLERLDQSGKMPIPNREANPYVDAFWKWWPELYQKLHTLRLTGGEPLMSKDCWEVLEAIARDPRSDLTLAINSNLDVPSEMIDRLIELLGQIGPRIKQVHIFTSGESTGARAEYVRFGLDYDRWLRNCDRILTALYGKMNLVFAFMTTVNIFSVSTFPDFLMDVLRFRLKFVDSSIAKGNVIPCMTNYLRWPQMLSVTNLDETTKDNVEKRLRDLIETHQVGKRETTDILWEDECNQIERLIGYMRESSVGDLDENRYNFKKFVDEYDIRRGTSFHTTFPELRRFYHICSETNVDSL